MGKTALALASSYKACSSVEGSSHGDQSGDRNGKQSANDNNKKSG